MRLYTREEIGTLKWAAQHGIEVQHLDETRLKLKWSCPVWMDRGIVKTLIDEKLLHWFDVRLDSAGASVTIYSPSPLGMQLLKAVEDRKAAKQQETSPHNLVAARYGEYV